jgi:hypothetical protein
VVGWTSAGSNRSDFAFDLDHNCYVCPGGKELKNYHCQFSKPRDGVAKGKRVYLC